MGQVLVEGVEQVSVLLLCLPRVLAGWGEKYLLKLVVQVLSGLRCHLSVGYAGLQVADERGGRSGGWGQIACVRADDLGMPVGCRVRLACCVLASGPV